MPDRHRRVPTRSLAVLGAASLAIAGLAITQPITARPPSSPAPVPVSAFAPIPPLARVATATPSVASTPFATPAPTPPPGPTHVVARGDTLAAIASWHRVDESVLTRWNRAASGDFLPVGARIRIPGGAPMLSTRAEAPTVRAVPETKRRTAPRPSTAPKPSTTVKLTGAMTHRWPLPVRGIITTRFSTAHPGIDIAAPTGTSVRAISAGTVTWAGWKNNGGGYVVVLEHPNGMRSTYNHNSGVTVRVGQVVAAGERIARVGATGNATGPHLDIRIEMGGSFVNPLRLF